jgi:hypothetical protein
MELGPEEIDNKPAVSELSQACSEILSEEDLAELSEMPMDEALGYAFTLLLESGVDDPEGYLKEKGVLQ